MEYISTFRRQSYDHRRVSPFPSFVNKISFVIFDCAKCRIKKQEHMKFEKHFKVTKTHSREKSNCRCCRRTTTNFYEGSEIL